MSGTGSAIGTPFPLRRLLALKRAGETAVLECLIQQGLFSFGKTVGRQLCGVFMGCNPGGSFFRMVRCHYEMIAYDKHQLVSSNDFSFVSLRFMEDIWIFVWHVSKQSTQANATCLELIRCIYPTHLKMVEVAVNSCIGLDSCV